MFRRFAQYLVMVSGLFLATSLQAQTATLTPTSLSFPAQVENTTSASQPVTLKNTGHTRLNITNIATSAQFGQTHTCGSTLAAGATCTVNVTFTPTTTGTINGTLTVTDSATNSPQTASLSGFGIAPVTLLPTSLTFGNQVVGTTSPSQNLTLKNNRGVALAISGGNITGDFAENNNCGTSLPAGQHCTITVTFTPTTTGTRNGTQTVNDNAPNSPQTASLTGTGIVAVSLSPASLAFGNQIINTSSAAQAVTVTNNQSTTVTVSSITTPTGFTQTNNCTTLAANGGACIVNVTFAPANTGTFSGNLTVNDNSVSGNPQTAPLSGAGINPAIPASFFAMDVNQNSTVGTGNPNDPWPGTGAASNVSFSTYRTLGSSIKWTDVYDCSGNGGLGAYFFDEDPTDVNGHNLLYKWAKLANPAQSIMFTAYYTPDCLVPTSVQTTTGSAYCAFHNQQGQNGQGEKYGCDLPNDVLVNQGNGLDYDFTQFIQHVVTYLSDTTYFPVQWPTIYIEVWNEPNVHTECNPATNTNAGNCTAPSLAQMTADANTTAKGINSHVKIISPAVTANQPGSGDCTGTAETINNYLGTLLSATPSVASNADIIGFHGYVAIPALSTAGSGKPDPAAGAACENDLINNPVNGVRYYVSQYTTTKPIYDTEGSWGADSSNGVYLPNSWINGLTQTSSAQQVAAEQAGYAGAYYLIQASNTLCPSTDSTCNSMAGFSWYGWDFDNQGTDPGSTGQFWDQWAAPSGALTPAGTAYTILYSWLNGASPAGPCSSSTGTAIGVWTCQFAGPGTSSALAVWDNSKTCVGTGSSPCTFSTYNFSANTYTEWRDLYGDSPTQLNGATSVSIGLVPILLDNGTVPARPTEAKTGPKRATSKAR